MSSTIRRTSCSFGCWARSAKWAESTASPESFVMRNPRGRKSFAGSRGGPNHEYSATGGVRVTAAARPRSSAVAICSALGWSSMACDHVGAMHIMISAQARTVLIRGIDLSRKINLSPILPRRAVPLRLADSVVRVYTLPRNGVATHRAGDRAADAGDSAGFLSDLREGPLPEHHVPDRRVVPMLGVQRSGPLHLPERGEIPEGSPSCLHGL